MVINATFNNISVLSIVELTLYLSLPYRVKPALDVTSIKKSPVLKGHLFLFLSKTISYELNLISHVTSLTRPIFLCPKGNLLIQVWLYIFLEIYSLSDKQRAVTDATDFFFHFKLCQWCLLINLQNRTNTKDNCLCW